MAVERVSWFGYEFEWGHMRAKLGARSHPIGGKLGRISHPVGDAVAMTAQVARHQLDRAQGAASTFRKAAGRRSGEFMKRRAALTRRSPGLSGVLLVGLVAGGVLLMIAAGRAGGLGARGGRRTRADADPDVVNHQEALLDEGLEESFPASDPLSVKRIT